MTYWIYKDRDGLWRWYLKSANDETKIAKCGQGYRDQIECKDAIDLVKASADAPVNELTSGN